MQLLGRFGTIVLVGLVFGCGSQAPSALPESHQDAATTLRDGQRPALAVIRRDGDPEPALAIAIAHDAGPKHNRGLARALGEALAKQGIRGHSSLFTRGLVFSFPVSDRDSNELMRVVRDAVLSAEAAAHAEPASAAMDPCDPLPAFEADRPELGRQNVALAVVANEDRASDLAEAFAATDPWPEGDVPSSDLPGADIYAKRRSARPGLSVAVRTGASERLLGAHAALRRHELLRQVAREFSPGFSLDELHASQLPTGGCLSLSFSSKVAATNEEGARLVLAVRDLVGSQLESAPSSNSLALPLVASSAKDTAELAAWQSLSTTSAEASRWLAVLATPNAEQQVLSDHGFGNAAKRLASRQRIALDARLERGQGRVWAALSSACPVAHETREDAGYVNLAMQHAAARSPEALKAFSAFGGPALIAHAPVMGDTEPERVADALAQGLLGSLDARGQLNQIARERRESEPWPMLVDFAAEMITHGRPSRIASHGTHDSLSRVSPAAVRNALLAFLRTPLSLTVLANQNEAQAARVRRRLELLLSPFVEHEPGCPRWPEPTISGSFVLVTDGGGPDVVLAFPIPVVQLHAARAVALLLDRPGGFLEQALLSPSLVTEATAAATGTHGGDAALIIALAAEPEALDGATRQVRALMQRISGGAIRKQHHESLTDAFATRVATLPEARLFSNVQATTLPSLDELRRFAHAYLTEEKLVVAHAKRRE